MGVLGYDERTPIEVSAIESSASEKEEVEELGDMMGGYVEDSGTYCESTTDGLRTCGWFCDNASVPVRGIVVGTRGDLYATHSF